MGLATLWFTKILKISQNWILWKFIWITNKDPFYRIYKENITLVLQSVVSTLPKHPNTKNKRIKGKTLTFLSHTNRRHFKQENAMSIILFTVSKHGHTASKESDGPEISESHSQRTISTKYFHRGERTGQSNPKWNHVR